MPAIVPTPEARPHVTALAMATSMPKVLAAVGSVAAQMDSAVAFLRQMESGDPDQVVQVIRQQQRAKMQAERDEMRAKLVNGELDVWSQFQDSVILGDSRASGFYYYSFLPRETVLAEPGDTIWTIEDNLDAVEAVHPGRAFIAYGANDMGYWSSPQDFTADVVQWYNDKCKVRDAGWAIANALFSVSMDAESEYPTTLVNLYKEYRDKLTMCKPEEFDALYAQYAQEYLDAGYQEIIDERAKNFEEGYSTSILNVTAEPVDLNN